MKNLVFIKLGIVGICSLFILTSLAEGIQLSNTSNPQPTNANYTGTLRVYVVEPVSRWNMNDQTPYHFGLLGIATETALDIPINQNYQHTFSWSGTFTEDNIMAIAAVFNSEGHQAYSYPPSSNPFTAYYVDAAAAATPGTPGQNKVNETYTHTVFLEEATATWCQYCPAMGHALATLYDSGSCNFYYAALIDDKSPDAPARIADFNLYGYPTAFFDGGASVLCGGNANPSAYKSRIINCGKREVPTLDLSIAMAIPSAGHLDITVTVTNGQANQPQIALKAGMGSIKATITNPGNTDITDLNWSLQVAGGIFNRIDTSDNGTIATLAAGASTDVQSARVFGMGTIFINAVAGPVSTDAQAFVLGPFIFLK
jgi:hypothetical protein